MCGNALSSGRGGHAVREVLQNGVRGPHEAQVQKGEGRCEGEPGEQKEHALEAPRREGCSGRHEGQDGAPGRQPSRQVLRAKG